MFLQEDSASQATNAFFMYEVLKVLIPSVVVGVLSYFLARRKNESEANKNESEVDKNEAETIRIYIEIIGKLNEEISSWIGDVKNLRAEVSSVERENDELKRQRRLISEEQEEKLGELHRVFKDEKERLIISLDKTINAMSVLLDQLIDQGIPQEERMKAVQILEMLHNLKEKLKK